MSKLTIKQENFCQEFVKSSNATKAYKKAYNVTTTNNNTIYVQANKILNNPKVDLRIKELKENLGKKHDITKDKILKHLCNVAFLDIKNLCDENGVIKDIHKLDKKTRLSLQGAELKQIGSGEFATTSIAYKLSDKLKAIEMINKMLGYNEADKLEHSGSIESIMTLDDFYTS